MPPSDCFQKRRSLRTGMSESAENTGFRDVFEACSPDSMMWVMVLLQSDYDSYVGLSVFKAGDYRGATNGCLSCLRISSNGEIPHPALALSLWESRAQAPGEVHGLHTRSSEDGSITRHRHFRQAGSVSALICSALPYRTRCATPEMAAPGSEPCRKRVSPPFTTVKT